MEERSILELYFNNGKSNKRTTKTIKNGEEKMSMTIIMIILLIIMAIAYIMLSKDDWRIDG
tara:strand:+ start:281 stop:463 length:183 start_codon:yes stop_codon:yes gene_type:complete